MDDRLREFDLGELEGEPVVNLTPEIWRLLGEEPHQLKAEGLPAAYERIKAFMAEIDPKPNTLVITHSGLFKVIAYYMKYQNGFDYSLFATDYPNLWIPHTTLIEAGINKS